MTKPAHISSAVARCPSTRTVHCERTSSCAHALADPKGRPVEDYSYKPRTDGRCIFWLDAKLWAVPDENKRQVQDAPEGLL